MPRVHLPLAPIEIPVSDRIQGATTIKQLAVFQDINIRATKDQFGQASCAVYLLLHVYLYSALPDGSRGPALAVGPGFAGYYERTLVADNNTAVNATTGQLLYNRRTGTQVLNYLSNELELMEGEPGADNWPAFVEAKPEALALQGDLFRYMMDNKNRQEGGITQLIEHHVLAADQMGHFNA